MVEGENRPSNFDFSRLREIATLKSTSKAVDTDWLGSDVEPTNAPANHRIQILIEGADSVVNIIYKDGTNTLTMALNGGTALSSGAGYVFDLIVPAGYSYNIQHSTTTQDVNVQIVESGVLS